MRSIFLTRLGLKQKERAITAPYLPGHTPYVFVHVSGIAGVLEHSDISMPFSCDRIGKCVSYQLRRVEVILSERLRK